MIMSDYEERALKEGERKGRLEGKKAGKQEGLPLGVLGLHAKNVPVDEIVKLLKVDESFVRKTIGSGSPQKTKNKKQKSSI